MKKFKSVVAILLVIAMFAVYAPLASAVNLKPDRKGAAHTGDVDNDGKVTASDARKVLRHTAKIELLTSDQSKKAADVDKDSNVTAMDARKILRYYAGLDAHPDADLIYRTTNPQAVKDAIANYNTAATKIKSGNHSTGSTITQTLSTKAEMSLSWLLRNIIKTLGENPDELEQGFSYSDTSNESYFTNNSTKNKMPPEYTNAVNINANSSIIYGMKKEENTYSLFFNPETYGVANSVYASAMPIEYFKMLEDPIAMMDDSGGGLGEFVKEKSKSIKFNSGYIKYTLDSSGNLASVEYYCNATGSYRLAFFGSDQTYMDMKITIELHQVYDFSKEITLDLTDAVKEAIVGINLFMDNDATPFKTIEPNAPGKDFKVSVPVGSNLKVVLVSEGGGLVECSHQFTPVNNTYATGEMVLTRPVGSNITTISKITRDAILKFF